MFRRQLVFTADEIWTLLPGAGRPATVFLAGFPTDLQSDPTLAGRWERLLAVRTAVYDPGFGDPRNGHDLAVVVLDQPLTTKPVAINRRSIDTASTNPRSNL